MTNESSKGQNTSAEETLRQRSFIELAQALTAQKSNTLGRPLTYCLTTFGCQMNEKQSEAVAGIMDEIGYHRQDNEEADVVIYNTCSVRENANLKVYGRLGHLHSLKDHNPDMKIILFGCMMQEQHVVDKIKKSYPFVNLVFGTHNIFKFAELFYEMEKHRDTVLVTLIDAAGSAPRKSGSQMLVGANGRLTGTIGGGAVERRSEEMAMTLLKEKRSAVHDFLLHTAASGGDIGMVCGGDVTAHFQFIPAEDASWQALASALTERLTAHQRGWLVLREDGGCGALLGPEGLLWGDLPEGVELISLQTDCVRRGGVFSMPLPIGERALLFGAGHISQALCPLLVTVGFRPVVFDCRPELATRKLFPTAEEIICGDFTSIKDHLTVTEEDFVVIMTNGHIHDFHVEEQILRGPFAYVGVIGSRTKTASVNRRLREAGIPEESIAQIHTPIGTAIQAVTPAEIAVSIAGEMILCRAERRGDKPHGCPMH